MDRKILEMELANHNEKELLENAYDIMEDAVVYMDKKNKFHMTWIS